MSNYYRCNYLLAHPPFARRGPAVGEKGQAQALADAG